jgi:hypothetical protein
LDQRREKKRKKGEGRKGGRRRKDERDSEDTGQRRVEEEREGASHTPYVIHDGISRSSVESLVTRKERDNGRVACHVQNADKRCTHWR